MVATLRRVAMRRPGPATLRADPALWNYAGPLDGERLLAQYDSFAAHLSESGAQIEWIDATSPSPDTTPSSLGTLRPAPPAAAHTASADAMFAFDATLITPGGAILLRPGKRLRQPEVRAHEAFHTRLGVPILGSVEAPGTAEGGDFMWLDQRTIAVGRGFRTNQAGIEQVGRLLSPLEIELHPFDLPMWKGSASCLHLMSLGSPLDRDLAIIYPRLFPVALHEMMRDCGIRCLLSGDEEFHASNGQNVNVLATAPRRSLAIAGYPDTVRQMRDAGCEVTCFEADALCLPTEGGPTCLTLPLLRTDA